ncbi:MAG: tetratricopeptide repeat protein [Bacteroidales bacterium]|nr:tetratricopeptide repeat protein [Bacteroidales bacterium]
MQKNTQTKIERNKPYKDNSKILSIILFVGAFFLYANTINNNYNLDDELVTRGHVLTGKGVQGLIDIFSKPYYSDASGNDYEYRPIVLASYAIEHQIFGENPHTGHFINTLLYALLILVLFRSLKLIFFNYNILLPFIVSLLFAAHPIHTEVVASLKNRDEILALMFGLLSLQYSLKFIKTNLLKNIFISLVFFTLALLTKKSIIPFAALIPLSAIIFYKPDARQLLFITLPLAVIAAGLTHFYYINTCLFFALAILAFSFLLWLMQNPQIIKNGLIAIKEHKYSPFSEKSTVNDVSKGKQLIDLIILIFTVVFSFSSLLLKSQEFLSLVFLLNIVVIILTYGRQSSVLLVSAFIPALMMLVFFGLFSEMFFLMAFLLLIFDIKNKYHIGLIIIVTIVHLIIIKTLILNLFYIFLIAIPVILFKLRKNYHSHKIISLILLSILVIANFISGNFENDVVYLFAAVLVLLFVFILNDHFDFKRKAFVFVLFAAVIAIPTENFFFRKKYYPVINITAVNVNEAAAILPASGRQLDFAEMPINKQTPLNIRLGTSFIAMAFYFKLLVFPHPLGFYYGYNMLPIVGIGNHWALIAMLMHLFLLACGLFYINKQKILAFGILFYLISLSAFSNIIAPVAGLIGERLIFTASLGFCIILAFFIFKIFKIKYTEKKLKLNLPTPFIITMSAILLLYGFKTITRNKDWNNHLSLFENDIHYLSRSAQAHNLYANALIEYMQTEKSPQKQKEMLNAAKNNFERALNIYPDFYNASFSLGKTYFYLEQYEFALNSFRKNLELDSTDYMVHFYTALNNENLGRNLEAIEYYENCIALSPGFADAYTSLSNLYLKLNKPDEAIEINDRFLKIKPDSYDHRLNMGKIYFNTGRLNEALFHFEKAFELNSSDKLLINALFEINNNLGFTEKATYYRNLLNQ